MGRDRGGSALTPRDLAELRDIVCADVEHLRQTWTERMDLHALRRDAATLRRLLVDNGGDLARLWRAEGREGQLTISGVADLGRFPHWRGLGFATAHAVETEGFEVSELLLWRIPEIHSRSTPSSVKSLHSPEIQAVLQAEAQEVDLTVPRFLESVCVVSNERPVRRVDLITYVANRRGGAHFDRRGKSGDPRRRSAHQVLDELTEGGYRVNERDAAFAQLVTIGRSVVDSPEV